MSDLSPRPWGYSYKHEDKLSKKAQKLAPPVTWPWVLENEYGGVIARFENPNDAAFVAKAVAAYDKLNELMDLLNLAHKTTLD